MYAVWLLPKQSDQKLLEKQIQELATKFSAPIFVPHITAYGLVKIDLLILCSIVHNSIKNIKPFNVITKDIDFSDNIWKTFFINIEMNQELELINQNLSKHLDRITHYDFQPHMSLVYKNISNKEKKLLQNNIETKKKFHIDKIAIQKFNNDIRKWKIIKSFNL